MTKLKDTFDSQDSRSAKTIFVVDITNSTELKLEQSEANWLTTYGLWGWDRTCLLASAPNAQ